ncbi:stalk domain-containing protein [Pelotomaculum terephthalicicum JT]|uniref:stalk domain-containing protein n=1 Tax=Pelotomaculum terephthalicicum TaxID=206393 RepID=UPI001F03A04F|nr:stalk domain-containing protein [Pelotomaculum terephthalicicum]MCG9967935.1 stalk domain-containing protein [Pelotomaculum terephthalicicum JT]
MTDLRKRLFFILAAMLITVVCTASVVYASSNMQTVQAYQGVRILYNGQELTGSNQPYIINDTTYVPVRMIMESISGKDIYWDPSNYQVVIADNTSTVEAALREQLTKKDTEISTLQNEISSLQSKITTLNTKISELEDEIDKKDSTSISKIEDELDDYFEDAGDDYFSDDGIDVSIKLSGDEDDLAYTIKLDFSYADNYSNLTKVSETKIKSFMSAVKSRINKEADGTDYEDAKITGKLVDNNYSNYYVKYNGSKYTYSWDNDSSSNSTDLSEIENELNDYFADAGDDYFSDDGIDVSVALSGDEDDLAYVIKLDFSDADSYANLTKVSKTKIKSFMSAVKSRINKEADGTDYEDAKITGKLVDNDRSSYYVKYNGSTYTFSWDS